MFMQLSSGLESTGPVRGIPLSRRELMNLNRLTDRHGRPIAFTREDGVIIPPGGMVADYPQIWWPDRAVLVAQAFGLVRAILGGEIIIDSSYRIASYNRACGGEAGSYHVAGLAIDMRCPAGVNCRDWYHEILALARTPAGRMIKGLGFADADDGNFVHLDCRPATSLVTWAYPIR
jgi:hypothetical protein